MKVTEKLNILTHRGEDIVTQFGFVVDILGLQLGIIFLGLFSIENIFFQNFSKHFL